MSAKEGQDSVSRWRCRPVLSLWKCWYCLLVTITEIYLFYRGITKCEVYYTLPWSTTDKPLEEFYHHIVSLAIALLLLPLFILTCLARVGNFTEDGERFGRGGGKVVDRREGDEASTAPLKEKARLLWKHCWPPSSVCHALAALLFLLPLIFIEARQIQHGFVSPDFLWTTDLDGPLSVINWMPPRISNFTARFESVASVNTGTSPEFWFLVAALLIYSVRYPASFWYTSASFSFLFSCITLVLLIRHAFIFCGTAALYKIQININSIRSGDTWDIPLLPPIVICALYLLAEALIFCSTVTVFKFGVRQFTKAVEASRLSAKEQRRNRSKKDQLRPNSCYAFAPNVAAIAALILAVIIRAPLIYQSAVIYRKVGLPIILVSVVIEVVYVFCWVCIWLVFTLKSDWSFKLLQRLPLEQMYRQSSNQQLRRNSLPKEANQRQVVESSQQEQNHVINRPTNPAEIPLLMLNRHLKESYRDPALGSKDSLSDSRQVSPNEIVGSRESLNRANRKVNKTSEMTPRGPNFHQTETSTNQHAPSESRVAPEDICDDVLPPLPSQHRSRPRAKRPQKSGNRPMSDSNLLAGAESETRARAPVAYKPSRQTSQPAPPSHNPTTNRGGPSQSPENTLKRNYRWSLRDQCESLYRPASTDLHSSQQLIRVEPIYGSNAALQREPGAAATRQQPHAHGKGPTRSPNGWYSAGNVSNGVGY